MISFSLERMIQEIKDIDEKIVTDGSYNTCNVADGGENDGIMII